MNNIKVSIVIPVHNVEAYLERCLDSVTGQTLKEIEVLCIDDASTDRTPDILRAYQNNDRRIKTITIKKANQGIARNLGIEKATGEYVGFVDGDDWVGPTMFEELYHAAAETESEISFCHANCYAHNMKRVPYPYFDLERKKFTSPNERTTYSRPQIVSRLSYITVVAWNKLYKRTFLQEQQAEFGNNVIHEDIPFFFKTVPHAARVTVLHKRLYNYSANRPGSTTNAAMSLSATLCDTLNQTEQLLKEELNEKEFARQFYLFKVTQLLSFINQGYHKEATGKKEKSRFFSIVRDDFKKIDPGLLKALTPMEKLQFFLIRNNQRVLFRLKTLLDAGGYFLRNPKEISRLFFKNRVSR